MKKLLIIHTKYRNTGGEDIAVTNEVNYFSKYFNVKVVYFDNSKFQFKNDFLAFLTNTNTFSNKKLKEEIDSFKPDFAIVHNTWFKANLGIFQVLKANNIKTFIKIHNYRYFCTYSFSSKKHLRGDITCPACGFKKKKFQIFNKYFDESYVKSFVAIIYGKRYIDILTDSEIQILVLTNNHKHFISKFLDLNDSIYVFPNILEVEIKNLDLSNQDNEDYLIYAGRLSEEKGVRELIENFLDIKINNLNLKIVGEGPEKKLLEEQYKDHKRIKFLGYLNNNEVKREILGSLAVVTATKLFEGQPTLLTEASKLAKPSIFPDAGGIAEFFPENYNYKFTQFDYDDLKIKINNLYKSNNYNQVGKENKKFIDTYLDEEKLMQDFLRFVQT